MCVCVFVRACARACARAHAFGRLLISIAVVNTCENMAAPCLGHLGEYWSLHRQRPEQNRAALSPVFSQ